MFKLTLGEIAAVENLSGVAIDAITEAGTPKGKALAALAFVVKKRENPDFTFEDALNMSMDDAMALIGDDDDPKDGD